MGGSLRSSAAALLPAGGALVLLAAWIGSDGGYDPADWYPGLFVLLGLLVAALLGLGARRRPLDRPALLALAAFGAYTAWSYASILWAGDEGLALEGANRTFAFFLAFALFVVLPWRAFGLLVLAAAFTAVVGVAGAITVIRLDAADQPITMFIDARLASPLGYQNANAALWTLGALPAIALAGMRGLPALARGILLGLGAMLLDLAVLAQSRGWLVTLPVVLLAAVLLVPGRLRFLTAFGLAAAACLAALQPLLDVYQAGGSRSTAEAAPAVAAEVPDAVSAIVLTSVALAAIGTLLALADQRVSLSGRGLRAARLAGAAVWAALAAAGLVATVVATDGDPLGRAGDAWDEFKAGERLPPPGTSSRFGNLGSARYDFWRVALDAAGDRPLGGLGQDNYAARFLAERRSRQEARWVHSLPLRLAAHTGFVGLALFSAGLMSIGFGVARARRRMPDAGAGVAGVCLLPLAAWLVFGSVDWLWEFPALSTAALALAGAGLAAVSPTPAGGRRLPRWAFPAAAASLVAVALVAAGGPYLAARHTEHASSNWGSDPDGAFERLDRASSLAPLSTRPHLVGALIALELDQRERAADGFRSVLERTPDDFFAHFELGLLASEDGDVPTARRELERARALNPREPLLRPALRRLGSRRPLTVAEANRELLLRARRLVGRSGE